MVSLAEEKDVDFLHETVEVLEHIIDAPGIKDEELDVIGELLSNLAGAIDVYAEIEGGKTQRDALNDFMKRVTGSIDK
jgi:hypothetical protein|tara:strand:+ start:9719 stop:9952 length:234 start_codon:yes stop_codon:yes gene_type:complete